MKTQCPWGAWSNEEESEEKSTETVNFRFMAIGETIMVRPPNYSNCLDLQNSIDMIVG